MTAADLRGFDAVVHLAALSNDPIGDLNERWTYEINLDATLRVARAAKEAGVRRFVFASSCSMYGASDTDELLDENAPLRPLTAYAESKVRAEEGWLSSATATSSPCPCVTQPSTARPPRLRLDIVLNNLAGWAHTTGRIRLLSDGRSWRPLIHVRDLSRVALAMLEAPDDLVRGEAFNVGSADQNYLIRDLAEVLADVTGCEVEFASDASPDPRSYRVDFSKLARAFPALQFEWDSRRGSEELVDAYRALPLTTSCSRAGGTSACDSFATSSTPGRSRRDCGVEREHAGVSGCLGHALRRSPPSQACTSSSSSVTRTSGGSSRACGVRRSSPRPD